MRRALRELPRLIVRSAIGLRRRKRIEEIFGRVKTTGHLEKSVAAQVDTSKNLN